MMNLRFFFKDRNFTCSPKLRLRAPGITLSTKLKETNSRLDGIKVLGVGNWTLGI